jgi:hypothetical protein
VALWAQEIEDVPGLDAQILGELLNLDPACLCCGYGVLSSRIQLAMIA